MMAAPKVDDDSSVDPDTEAGSDLVSAVKILPKRGFDRREGGIAVAVDEDGGGLVVGRTRWIVRRRHCDMIALDGSARTARLAWLSSSLSS